MASMQGGPADRPSARYSMGSSLLYLLERVPRTDASAGRVIMRTEIGKYGPMLNDDASIRLDDSFLPRISLVCSPETHRCHHVHHTSPKLPFLRIIYYFSLWQAPRIFCNIPKLGEKTTAS